MFIITDMGKVIRQENRSEHDAVRRGLLVVTVRPLAHAIHSGVFGGPAPDALIALIRMLATLHDERGDVAIAGLSSDPWSGAEFPEGSVPATSPACSTAWILSAQADWLPLWSKPSVTVIGIDAPASPGLFEYPYPAGPRPGQSADGTRFSPEA